MTYRGLVKNGMVVLEGGRLPPEGAQVSVRVLKRALGKRKRAATLYDQLKPFIGIGKELPPDFSVNHDHYLYGAAKKK